MSTLGLEDMAIGGCDDLEGSMEVEVGSWSGDSCFDVWFADMIHRSRR